MPSRSPAAQPRRDSLLRNSSFLMFTTAAMAVGNVLFWLVAARFYAPGPVGSAASLLCAIVLLAYFSALGMGGPLVRHLSISRRPEAAVGTALCTVATAGLVIGLGYGVSLPLIAPELLPVHHRPWLLLAFALLTTSTAINLLTDYVFLALRAARHNFVVNGLVLSAVKLGFVFGLVRLGSLGIVAAAASAAVLSAVLKIVILRRGLGLRFAARINRDTLRRLLGFSTAEYLAGCLSRAPQLIVPLILLVRLGPAASGAYFLAFQVAALLHSVSYAVTEAMLAEGTRQIHDPARIGRRSAAVIALFTVPGAGLVIGAAPWILRAFSPGYSHDATRALIVLAFSALAVAFYCCTTFLLKVARQFEALVVTNAVLVIAVTVLVAGWAGRGIGWAAAAWGIGNLLAGGVAGGVLVILRPRPIARAAEPSAGETATAVVPAEPSTGEAANAAAQLAAPTVEIALVEIPQQEKGVNR